jgi:sulfite exporter TauE/SafE
VTGLETLVAAALLGLITMPHCLVMCGPVAVMACSKKSGTLPYLGGRLIAYAAVGSVMGVIGAHAFTTLGADWVGRITLAVLAGTCVYQAYRIVRPAGAKLIPLSAGRTRIGRSSLLSTLSFLLPKRGLGLGMATAVFPCGALPAAWALSASSGHPLTGAGAMLAFALASTPALLIAVGGRSLFRRLAERVPRVVQAGLWLGVATLFVARAWLVETACHG